MKRTSLFLSQKQMDELNLLASVLDLPVAEIIRRGLDEYLKTQERIIENQRNKERENNAKS